jgi:urease accessory protein
MHTDRETLILAQWLSPAYPLGSFSWSHGLEAAVETAWVRESGTLGDWIRDILEEGSGRSDATLIRLAHAADDIGEIDAVARAFAPSRERLAETVRQGEAFARTTSEVWGIELPDLVLPVAVGRAARALDLDIERVVPFFLQSFASNLVSAAQRLMPLGQSAAQAIVADLHEVCLVVAQETRGAEIEDLYSNAFLADVAAMRHETQDVRLFQS